METWHVYQFRDDTQLLYVGHTRRLKRRISEHGNSKSWWPEVTEIWAEEFATEDEARQREKEVWACGRPKYNRVSPFVSADEYATQARDRVRQWRHENAERKREYERRYLAANYEDLRAYHRDWQRRNRPTTVAGRRLGRPWQQGGPGLFD
jgi:predicted GIY-YIG superfamily endonuclease